MNLFSLPQMENESKLKDSNCFFIVDSMKLNTSCKSLPNRNISDGFEDITSWNLRRKSYFDIIICLFKLLSNFEKRLKISIKKSKPLILIKQSIIRKVKIHTFVNHSKCSSTLMSNLLSSLCYFCLPIS